MIPRAGKIKSIAAACMALVGVLSVAAVSASWAADDKKPGADQPAKARTLFGITWQPSRSEALKKATPISAKDPLQPVFLVQMLGDLAGHT